MAFLMVGPLGGQTAGSRQTGLVHGFGREKCLTVVSGRPIIFRDSFQNCYLALR